VLGAPPISFSRTPAADYRPHRNTPLGHRRSERVYEEDLFRMWDSFSRPREIVQRFGDAQTISVRDAAGPFQGW
jgi:hypothetical protein